MAVRKDGTPPPDDLSIEEQQRVWAWVQKTYPHLTKKDVRFYVDWCLDHFRDPNVKTRIKKDWSRACINWIRREEGRPSKPRRRPRGGESSRASERPQEPRTRGRRSMAPARSWIAVLVQSLRPRE